MANKHRGEVIAKIGDRQLSLRPTIQAIIQVEDALGFNPVEIVDTASSYIVSNGKSGHLIQSKQAIEIVLHCANAAGENITREELHELIDESGCSPHAYLIPAMELLRNHVQGGAEHDEGKPKAEPKKARPVSPQEKVTR